MSFLEHKMKIESVINEMKLCLPNITIPVDNLTVSLMIRSGKRMMNILDHLQGDEAINYCQVGVPRWISGWMNIKNFIHQRFGRSENELDRNTFEEIKNVILE